MSLCSVAQAATSAREARSNLRRIFGGGIGTLGRPDPYLAAFRATLPCRREAPHLLSCQRVATRSFAPVVTVVLWAVPRAKLTFGFEVIFTVAGGCS